MQRARTMWRLTLLLVILIGLLFPSCGFVGLLFDGDDENGGQKYYDVNISYNYTGGRTVNEDSPLVMLLIPLNSDMQFDDEGFDNATVVPNNFSPGVATVLSLESGAYAILGFIDEFPLGNRDGQVNKGEVYSFYNMREFVESITAPDYIMVDEGIETYTPHFELDDSFLMDGFLLFAPRQGDTVYGEGIGYIHAVGFTIDPTIETIEIRVDGTSQGTFPASQEVFTVNMSTYSSGSRNLEVFVYGSGMTPILDFDQAPLNFPVNFNYVAP